MNASKFVQELAGRLGKETNNVWIYDRALVKSGLRDKSGRGRHAGDIKCKEAVMILLAILSGRPATKAATAATDLSKFSLVAGQSEEALKAFHYAFGLENDFKHLIKKPLVDLMVLLCGRLANGELGEDNFAYLCIKDGAWAELQFEMNWLPGDRSQRLGLSEEVAFNGAVDTSTASGNYYESRTVTGNLLRWIGEVTKAN